MKNRVILIILSIFLIITITACGSNNKENEPSNKEEVSSSLQSSQEENSKEEVSKPESSETQESENSTESDTTSEVENSKNEDSASSESPKPTATVEPTIEPTVEPTSDATATPVPTATPTAKPTPTIKPVVTPTPKVTVKPTPTAKPTVKPTATPKPTVKPTPTPTPKPTVKPTATPTPTPTPTPTATPTPTPKPSKEIVRISSAETVILNKMNELRTSLGLEPLKINPVLSNVAKVRGYELTEQYNSDHSRPDGSSCFTAFNECGYDYLALGENIVYARGYAQSTIGDTFYKGWFDSPGHYKNMVSENFTEIGICVVYDQTERKYYGVQSFGKPR